MNQDFVSRLILSLDTHKRNVPSRSQPEKNSNLSSLDKENENTHLFTRQSIPTSGQPSAPETRRVVSCGLPDIPVEQNGSPFPFPADYGNSALPPQPVPDYQPTCSTASSSGSNTYYADDVGTTSKQDYPEPVSEFVALAPDGVPTLLPAPSMGLSGHSCWPLWTPVRHHHPHLPYLHPYNASAVACDSAFHPLHPPPPPPPPPPFAVPWRYHPYARHFRTLPHAGSPVPANVGVTWPRRLMYGGRSLWHSPSGVRRHPARAPRQHYLVPPPQHDAAMLPYAPRAGAWALGCHPWGFEAACAVHHEDAFEPQMVAPGDHVNAGYGVWDAVATGFAIGGEGVLGGDAAAGLGNDVAGGFGSGAFRSGAASSDKGGIDASEGRASSAVVLAEHGQWRECTANGVTQNVPDMYGSNALLPCTGDSQNQLLGEGYGRGAVVAEGGEGGVGVQQEARRVDVNGDAATATEGLAADTAPEVAASVAKVAAAAVDAVAIESRPALIDAEAATMMFQCNSQPLSTSLLVQRPGCFPAQPRVCVPVLPGSLKRMAPPPPPAYASVAAATGAAETAGDEAAAPRPWGYDGEEPPRLRRRRCYSLLPTPSPAVPPMLPALAAAAAAAAPAVHQPPAHGSAHEPSPLTLAPPPPLTPLPPPPPPPPMLNVHATAAATTSLSPAATAAAPQRQHVLPYRMVPCRQHLYCYFGSAHATAPAAAAVNFQGPAAVPEPETDPDVVTSVDEESVPLGPIGFGAPDGQLTADDNRFFFPWPPRQALPYGPVRSTVPPSAGWTWQPVPPYTYVPYRPVPAVAGPSSASPTFMSEHCFMPRNGMEMWPMVVIPQA